MKASFRVLTAVFLCAVSLACYWFGRKAEARSGLTARPVSVRNVAVSSVSAARADWRLGSPFSHENLTVFPVIADEPAADVEFITLDEGLRSGKVLITELGAAGGSPIVGRRHDGAEVNRLALTNNSGKTLVLIAGEMILGGKQDRIVGHDCIIESAAAPVPIDVFCVEHGRWSGPAAFGQSVGSTGQVSPMVSMTAAPMALPKIREKAQAKKNQSEVWNEVAKTVTVNGAGTSTGTLTSVYQDKRVNAMLAEYETAFAGKLADGNIVGVVAAVGGKIISADVFASHSLFQAYWPKMLKSYALEAVGTPAAAARQVSKSEAEAFLARVEGDSASGEHKGVYRLAENQSSADASFELEYTRKTPTLIHFNRVSKK